MSLTDLQKEHYKDLIMEVDTNIDIESVILSDENKDKLNEFLKEYSYRDKFKAYGLEPMNRLLFYGASGTGKTYLSKALANKLGYKMLYVDIAKSLSEGNVSMNISKIFELSHEINNCIIFLDEADSVAWKRDSITSEGGNIRRATNSIFQHLDQMSSDTIFIAATNMLHQLDPAFERRFNLKFEFRRPELDLEVAIKKFLFDGFTVKNDVDKTVKSIVEKRTRLSYYEIQTIVERAMKRAIMRDTTVISTSEIYNDFAIAMKIKINFKTDKDDEKIFNSSIV